MKEYAAKYRLPLILGPLFKILEVFFDLLVPAIMNSVIDIGIANGDKPYITSHIILIIALGLTGFICTAIAQFFAARAGVGVASEIRSRLFAHIQSLSEKEMDQFSYSSLNSRLTNDTYQVQNGLNLAIRLLVRSPFIVFGAFFMAWRLSPRLSLIFIVMILILLVIVSAITLLTIPMYGQVQKQLDSVMARLKDNLTGVRILRAFNRQKEEISQFEQVTQGQLQAQKRVAFIANLLNPLTYALVNVAIILIIHFGAIQISAGQLSTGNLIALYNYLSQILIELIKLVNLIIVINRSLASYRRIQQVINTPNSLPLCSQLPQTAAGSPALEFRNVSFRYPSSAADTLEDISFSLSPGQCLGIIGATGSGKSTIADLIARHYDVTAGQILLNGADIRDYPLEELHQRISLVYQKASLFSGTVRSNLLTARGDASEAQMISALKDAQVFDSIDGDLDRSVSQSGTNFSGGQRQRLTIAQAFLRNADILILDDATSALDFKTESLIREKLAESRQTLIIISQRVSNMISADAILVLDNGRAVGLGSHRQLLASCPVYQETCASQQAEEVA
jgi:ABC-type multidrug transport system fused ATPase/permease subunit